MAYQTCDILTSQDVDESEQLSGSGISSLQEGKRNSFTLPFKQQINVFYFTFI